MTGSLANISALIASVVVAATATAAPQYQIYAIGVGRSVFINGAQAFTWTQNGGLAGLPNLVNRSFRVANSANDSGIVVGTGSTGANPLPVIWQSGVVSQLPLRLWNCESQGTVI
jgi:hypothetical protein